MNDEPPKYGFIWCSTSILGFFRFFVIVPLIVSSIWGDIHKLNLSYKQPAVSSVDMFRPDADGWAFHLAQEMNWKKGHH